MFFYFSVQTPCLEKSQPQVLSNNEIVGFFQQYTLLSIFKYI